MFPQLARYDAADERLGLIGGSVAASLLVALVVVSLPRPVGVVMLVALPLLAVVGALQGGDFSSVPGEGSQTPRARDAVNVPLLLCAFVFAFSVTFFRGIAGGSSGIGDQPAAFSLTFLAIAVVLVPLLAFDRLRKSPLLVFVFVPMLAAGILLLPFLVGEDRLVSSVLINTARNLFSVYLYSSHEHGVFAAGLVVGVGDLGHVVAALWERSFGLATSLQVLVVCVAIAYVAFMCALLLFYPTRLQREVFGAAPASAGEVQSPATDVAPLELAAHEAGLSDREVEVLRLLIGSRTMASIADELGISYNTAKTHASHIFRKAGVCSREELARWVETFAE
jgi:DNA-binding CsgD family transcriptional regulator